MSLTEAQAVFASINETALNDLIVAFCTDRPRLLFYGSPSFVPTTTVAETSMPAIGFPGITGGIQWRIRFNIPHVDLFKQNDPLPPQLTLGPGRFSLHVTAEICIDCRRIKIDPKPPRTDRKGSAGNDQPPSSGTGDTHPPRELTCCKLDIFAIGHLERVLAANGEDAVALAVDAVEIVDITPDDLESFLECLLFMILQAVLADVRLPLRAIRAGAFQLVPVVGPLIEDDQIKMRGNL